MSTECNKMISLINGPNMKNLGPGGRDQATYGTIGSLQDLEQHCIEIVAQMGWQLECFASNHEGEILEYIHGAAHRASGFLINPAGLNLVSEAARHALQETKKPVVELHFSNVNAAGWDHTVFTKTATGLSMGMRQYSYTGALLALIASLEDGSFLGGDTLNFPQSAVTDGRPGRYL